MLVSDSFLKGFCLFFIIIFNEDNQKLTLIDIQLKPNQCSEKGRNFEEISFGLLIYPTYSRSVFIFKIQFIKNFFKILMKFDLMITKSSLNIPTMRIIYILVTNRPLTHT